jgi:hypothetical protein
MLIGIKYFTAQYTAKITTVIMQELYEKSMHSEYITNMIRFVVLPPPRSRSSTAKFSSVFIAGDLVIAGLPCRFYISGNLNT